jgi:dTDP-4-amino-4,6-dideoxygalactose transaminase
MEAVRQVLESRWLGRGKLTKEFEDRIAERLGVKHVVAVNSGTAALHMALDALGLEPGDEVIVPSLTFVSSVQAILAAGGRPVFCEVSPETLNIDVDHAASCVTERTRAILPVHFGGRVCDMEGLRRLTEGRGIRLVEDAAHAFGSGFPGEWAGALGDLGCFSFDPIKNITCGGGGAVATNDDNLGALIRKRHNVGLDTDSWSRLTGERPWFYKVVEPGYRYYMGNLNAAIGLAQLRRMDQFRERKRVIVRRYDEVFSSLDGLAVIRHDLEGVFPFNYVVRVLGGQRDSLMIHLKECGIGTTIQFIPNHRQPVFAEFASPLPVTEWLYEEIVTLPLYYEMTDADVDTVIDEVAAFLRNPAAAARQPVLREG